MITDKYILPIITGSKLGFLNEIPVWINGNHIGNVKAEFINNKTDVMLSGFDLLLMSDQRLKEMAAKDRLEVEMIISKLSGYNYIHSILLSEISPLYNRLENMVERVSMYKPKLKT
jgi:hypothetical protein